MSEPARVIAQPDGNARDFWDANDQVANRLREIIGMTRQIQDRIQYGELHTANRLAIGIKLLAKEALDLRKASKGRRK